MAHADDPVSHGLHLTLPLLVQLLLSKDGARNSGSVERWVRVHGSNHDLQLAVHAGLLFWSRGDQGECTDTFAIQAHVLREGLRKRNLMAFRNEVTDSERVTRRRARRESLIRHIEEGEETLLLDDVGDFDPLFRSGINTSGVVRTGVEQYD